MGACRTISSRQARALLALAVLAACCVAAVAFSRSATAAPGLAERPQPPSPAEVKRWEAQFLASNDGEAAARPVPASKASKAAGRRLFPQNRVVSLYGAAGGFGVLGRRSLNGAANKLRDQVKPYRRHSPKPVIPAFDLVAVIATQCGGSRDKCRVRVSDSIISRYLKKVRKLDGRLILDIQPGRSNVLSEIKHLRPFIRKPDVDVAIDAEWNVGRREEPGQDAGSIQASRLNRAIKAIRRIQNQNDLSPKLLIVHQFSSGSVKHRSRVNKPSGVDVTINFDGIGSPAAKRAGYANIHSPRLFNGFSLFYKLDSNLMKPSGVLRLNPKPNYVMYQ